MKKLKLIFLILVGAWPMFNCNSLNGAFAQKYAYIPLKDFKYDSASIKPGTELELIAFSGGKQTETDQDVYYYQFIAVNKATRDTVRILTPWLTIKESKNVEDKTYVKPWQFDSTKRVTDAVYELCDSSSRYLLETDALIEKHNLDTSASLQSLREHLRLNEFVVVNKTVPIFEKATLKTSIGILHFKEIAW